MTEAGEHQILAANRKEVKRAKIITGVIVLDIHQLQNMTLRISFYGDFHSVVRTEGACREGGEEAEIVHWNFIGIRLCVQMCLTVYEQETIQGLVGWVGFVFHYPVEIEVSQKFSSYCSLRP